MNFYERIQSLEFGWRDAIDIAVVALIIYSILRLIRGTRAMQMSIGLFFLGAGYFLARALDLVALETLTREILIFLPIAIIVLFQHEIRRALANFGRNPFLPFLGARGGDLHVEAIVEAVRELARRKIGALIVLERTQSLRAYIESGKAVDALLTTELLINIFTPNTPLHDGAVVVRANRIASASTFLPLTANPDSATRYGTRHRAALGMSEETDALVVVVSEENGSIAVAIEAILHEDLEARRLEEMLRTHQVAARADL